MRNMYNNRKETDDESSHTTKGRHSAMTAPTSKFCTFCNKKGHVVQECFKKQRNMKPAGNNPGGRRGDWCTLHRTSRHDNSNCREQQQNNAGSNGRQQQGRQRGQGQRNNTNNGQRNNTNGDYNNDGHYNNSGNYNGNYNNNGDYNNGHYAHNSGHLANNNGHQHHANYGHTNVPPSSTTMVNAYNPAGQNPPGASTAPSTPPAGVGFSFLASQTSPEPARFTMTVDTGASSHFVDTDLLPEITNHMIEYTKIDPPLVIDVAGKGKLQGTAMGAVKVNVSDHHGLARSIRLPFICVPTLGRHLLSGGTAMKHGIGVLFTPKSPCLDMGAFKIPVYPDSNCDTLFHFELAIAPDSVATQHAFTTVSGADLPPGRANVVTIPSSTATAAGAPTASPQATPLATTTSKKASSHITFNMEPAAVLPPADAPGEFAFENLNERVNPTRRTRTASPKAYLF